MIERTVDGLQLCLANHAGDYAAVDNTCPHRGAPLNEGTLEDGKLVCPWHAWGFDLKTGKADQDASAEIRVHTIRFSGDEVEVEF